MIVVCQKIRNVQSCRNIQMKYFTYICYFICLYPCHWLYTNIRVGQTTPEWSTFFRRLCHLGNSEQTFNFKFSWNNKKKISKKDSYFRSVSFPFIYLIILEKASILFFIIVRVLHDVFWNICFSIVDKQKLYNLHGKIFGTWNN